MSAEVTHYELLGVDKDCSEKQIAKAYRKKALQCHPDKNPDNPNAADLFHKLSKAFEVIGNPHAKAAYDATLKAKERVRLRTQAYDSKRKKFKEDLEQKEKTSQDEHIKEDILVKNLEQEIERLREEGRKLLEQEQKIMKEQIAEEREKMKDSTLHVQEDLISSTPKLKIRWKTKKSNASFVDYTQELLNSMFRKYGEIENLLVSSKKKGSAIIEFKDFKSAEMAFVNEMGNPANPLKITWLHGGPGSDSTNTTCEVATPSPENNVQNQNDMFSSKDMFSSSQTGLTSNFDYESLVMRKLRQAEERKRLCEELAKEAEES